MSVRGNRKNSDNLPPINEVQVSLPSISGNMRSVDSHEFDLNPRNVEFELNPRNLPESHPDNFITRTNVLDIHRVGLLESLDNLPPTYQDTVVNNLQTATASNVTEDTSWHHPNETTPSDDIANNWHQPNEFSKHNNLYASAKVPAERQPTAPSPDDTDIGSSTPDNDIAPLAQNDPSGVYRINTETGKRPAAKNGMLHHSGRKADQPHRGNVSEKSSSGGDEKESPAMVGFTDLFKYSDKADKALMVVGSLAAIVHGAALPLMIIVFGDMLDSFVDNHLLLYCANTNSTLTTNLEFDFGSIKDKMGIFALYYIGIGCGVFLFAYLQMTLWTLAANRQVHRLRKAFYKAVLRQEMAWFDTHRTGELATEMDIGISKIHSGIGDKVALFIQWMTGFFAGFTVGFIYGWKLTLVILAVSPLLALAAGIISKLIASLTNKEMKAYAKAGAVAEEVLSSIRTVKAFNGEMKASKIYAGHLTEAEYAGVKRGVTSGVGMGVTWLIVFATYGLGFWYGFTLVRDSFLEATYGYTAGTLLTVFFAVIIGAFSIGHAAPNLSHMATARGAAVNVYEVIESRSKIDCLSENGERPVSITGIVQFENVQFSYPSRPEILVLKGIHLKFCVGETVALVGESGCGKSTIAQLVQRFYDPDDGRVTLDGENIKRLNVHWLRQQIGVVSQEPVLFTGTIAENIQYGCEKEICSQIDIETAARNANAHDFIMMLPKKYDTEVGEQGAQLSGGQKQRIAIARALIRHPRLLILDEATSALDNESEAAVQSFLRSSNKERVTIVIAHRLSTVMNADKILVIRDGTVVEEGNHDSLMQQEKYYYDLVTTQTFNAFANNIGDAKANRPANNNESVDGGKKDSIFVQRNSLRKDTKSSRTSESTTNNDIPKASVVRVMRYNKPEVPWIIFGCFCALINGGSQPAFAVIFSEILGVFSECDLEVQEQKITLYSLLFVAIGVGAGLSMFFESFCFGKSGEALTRRFRQLTFDALLSQEIAYFDNDNNAVGALTSRLATDASQVQGATGARLGTFAQSISNMGVALVLAFIFGWQLALLIIGFVPFIVLSGVLSKKLLVGDAEITQESLEAGSQIVTETLSNIKTVASITKEGRFYKKFEIALQSSYNKTSLKAHLYGLSMSFSQSIIYFTYAATFYFGGYLIETGQMTYRDVFLVFSAIVFGAMGLGQASSFAPDYAKAKVSAGKIFAILDRVPKIDNSLSRGDKFVDFHGTVAIRGVTFQYPTRPDVHVLNDISLSVTPGQTVALVGHSGCGKSTIAQILERFYDPDSGQILFDGFDAKSLNVPWLRSQIGIVFQEPVLFDTTIQQNISYGDNSRNDIPMAEVVEAAKQANIHDFITSLPQGYETNVGKKGTQLSGGQKQRIAIARAILKNPKILILDEATSALDAENEEIVQAALDKASEGRTCLIIAHRLSTIKNADCILVIQHGKVAESGTHDELMKLGKLYYSLHVLQIDDTSSND